MAEDSSLMETAFECRGDMESFHKSLEDMSALPQSVSPVTVADEGMNQIQSQLQQLKIGQHHASIKFPKLEIPTFNGEKLKWTAFWDTFEANIHHNPTLSDTEKLNCLNSKLTEKSKGCCVRNSAFER